MISKRRFRKRGQLDVPFHLIFTMVGGALFLIFFFILIRSIVSGGERDNAADLSFAVETIIATSMTNPDTFSVARLQEARYIMVCDDSGSYVRPSGKNIKAEQLTFDTEALARVPFFSLRAISGDELYTSTHTWEAPFAIGNLVAVGNNRTRYIFVAPRNGIDAVDRFIEAENLDAFDIQTLYTTGFSSIQPQGHDHYRFVFFDYEPTMELQTIESRFADAEYSVVHVDLNGGTEKGTLQYYAAGQTSGDEIPFYGDAMLVAGIFAADHLFFQCNIQKALARYESTRTLLQRRAQTLQTQTEEQCTSKYQAGQTLLATLVSHDEIDRDKIEELSLLNRQLLSMDCPLIY
jgi:hypothetical protein